MLRMQAGRCAAMTALCRERLLRPAASAAITVSPNRLVYRAAFSVQVHAVMRAQANHRTVAIQLAASNTAVRVAASKHYLVARTRDRKA